MTEFFFNYGLFLAKVATFVVAIGLVAAMVFMLRREHDDSQLTVRKLNERFETLGNTMAQATLPKDVLKARNKDRRKAEKARAKADKAARKLERKAAGTADGAGSGEGAGSGQKAAAPAKPERPRVFVIDFRGDIRASAVTSLREEVTAVLTLATADDEVLVKLENAGGHAHEHGLAASQLLRVRERGVPLTIAVDKVAASGGYMMACVGNRIIAAPFAILGSIGVLLQLPNFHRLLNEHGVDYETIKGGEFKRTLTIFGENSPEARAKAQEEVEDVHALFKEFVLEQRPQLEIERVATGEHWFGRRALELNLCDALKTSDDYLLERSNDADIYELRYKRRKPVYQKLADGSGEAVKRALDAVAGAQHARRVGAG